MNSLLKKTVILAAVVVVALVGAFFWWHSHRAAKLSFTTAEVKRGNVASTISATGTIEPLEVVDVGAQVAGRVSTFGPDNQGKTVDYGSVVEQGSLLAKSDDSVYAADLSVAKAGELSAAANLDQAEAEWKRTQSLFENKLISQVDFDAAKANYEVAKANVSVAQSGIA